MPAEPQTNRARLLPLAAVVLSVALFAESLRLPALLFSEYSSTPGSHAAPYHHICFGQTMFLASLLGPLSGNFAGVSNLLWLAGGVLLLRGRVLTARRSLGIALLLTLLTFQLYLQPFPFDEGGVMKGLLLHPLLGWYLWVGSILLLYLAALLTPAPPVARPPDLTSSPQ